MPAIAYQYPDEVRAIREGLDRFLKTEIVARHERHATLLDNERNLFTDDGRYHPDALALITEVRIAAARAGYYTMCVPTDLGGQGLGNVAWFGAWERIFHTCADHYWLGHYVLSHWAFGPSAVLRQLGIARMLDGLISVEDMRFAGRWHPKPSRRMFRLIAARLRVPAARCVMVEDSIANLAGARAVGMRTVLISGLTYRSGAAAYRPRAGGGGRVGVQLQSISLLPRLRSRLR